MPFGLVSVLEQRSLSYEPQSEKHPTSTFTMPDLVHQGWIDGHPEIGKMQKDIFDDIFDTTDDDATEENDPAPIVPTPTDFTDNCSCLDHAR